MNRFDAILKEMRELPCIASPEDRNNIPLCQFLRNRESEFPPSTIAMTISLTHSCCQGSIEQGNSIFCPTREIR
jgi:hypothetical protein